MGLGRLAGVTYVRPNGATAVERTRRMVLVADTAGSRALTRIKCQAIQQLSRAHLQQSRATLVLQKVLVVSFV